MNKRDKEEKHEPSPPTEPEPLLGEDPLADFDVSWLLRDQGELSIEVLGHDPFEGMDLEWLDNETESLLASPTTPKPVPGTLVTEMGFSESEETTPLPTAEISTGFASEDLFDTITTGTSPASPIAVSSPAPLTTPTPEATFHFPADFKWGVAVSAHQVEGANTNNDWWAWEEVPGHIKNNHRSGAACNWWTSAEADFDRAAALGVNALRLSVEWSRIEPQQGVFDDGALQRYAQMLQALRARRIEPMVTLHHFTNPLWVAQMGGWENPETVSLFARFARRVVETLGHYCDLWCTINEPNVYVFAGYIEGRFPPGKSDPKAASQAFRNLLAGHAAAYREIHSVQGQAQVGIALHMRVFDPAKPESAVDRQAAAFADRLFNQAVLDALVRGRWTPPLGSGSARRLRHTLDWVGLNYYARDRIAFDRKQKGLIGGIQRVYSKDAELLDGDFGEFYPQGMFRCIQRLARYNLPIYITENGIPDNDDDQRPRYLVTHLHQVWRALQFSYPVMGYYHWTLVDNFEWADGWTLRFGLFELDPRTQLRTARSSASLYASIVHANAITPQILDAHCPELRPSLLPGRVVSHR